MASDVSVRFTGDLSQLDKSAEDAKATLAAFASSTSNLKSSIEALNASLRDNTSAAQAANTGWRANLQTLADLVIVLYGAKAAVESFAETMTRAAAIDGRAVFDIQAATFRADADAARALTSAVESIPGAITGATEAIYAYADAAAQGTGAARSFIHDQDGIVAAIGRVVVQARTAVNELRLYQTSVAKDELAGIFASGGGKQFVDAVGLDKLKESLVGFTAQLQRIPNMSDEAAASIQVILASVPNYSTEANDGLIKLISSISSSGDEAVANAQKITAALQDGTATGGQTLASMVSTLVEKLRLGADSAADFKAALGDIDKLTSFFAGNLKPEAASAYYAAILSKLQQQQDLQKTITDANAAQLQREGVLGNLISASRRAQVDLEIQQNAERQKAIDLLTQQKAVTDQILAAQTRQATFGKTLEKANPTDAQIDDVNSKISTLQGRLDRSSGQPALTAEDITALVRTVMGEAGNQPAAGQLAVAAVALNRLANGNFGDSLTAVLKAGNGSQFNTWKPNDPTGAQAAATDSYQFQRTLHDIVMPLLDKRVSDPTGGALNFLNPSTADDKSWMNSMTNQRQIGDHLFGTARNSPDPIAPLDEDDTTKAQQALEALQDKLRQLQTLKAGGTATDKANLDIATKAAAEGEDQVEAAKKLVEAKKDEFAATAGGSPGAQLAAEKALADAEINLRNKTAEAAVAASKVEADMFVKNSAQETAALNAGLAEKLAAQKIGTAGYNETLAEMIANTRRAVEQEKQDQAAAADAAYQNTKRRLEEQLADLKAASAEKRITLAEETAQANAIYAQQADAARAYEQKRQQIFGEGTSEYRKASEQLLQVDEKLHQAQLTSARDAARQVEQEWKSAFEQVGSSVSSSLMGMLEGTTTFRRLLQNVARQVTSMILAENVKQAADFLAKKALEVAATVSGEDAKTGAVAAGTAAREALSVGGAASAAATTLASVTQSILASASEAFAGVFGFLSPIMGPAAVGPAGAAQATVAAKAALPGFAIGSWGLSADTVAQVHKGEMIVPAAATPWAQSLMANAAGGGGAGGGSGGDTTIHIHAFDGPSVDRWLRTGGALQIGKALKSAGPNNPKIR